MNQAASAAARAPAGSTATASCCPMFSNPFFMNTFTPQATILPPPQAQQCFLGAQATQLQPLASINTSNPSQQINVASQHQQPAVSQSTATPAQQERSQQPPRIHDHGSGAGAINLNNTSDASANYNTSFNGPTLSLQHLLANRHSATNCMALAAALAASASFPHFQQLQHQNQPAPHQSSTTTNTSIASLSPAAVNQAALATNAASNTNPPNPVSQSNNSPATITTQVPLLNFNSYNTAPQNLNVAASNAPQLPIAAHHNLAGSNQLPQRSFLQTAQGLNTVDTIGQNRPLATNTNISNLENQQQHVSTAYRRPPTSASARPQQQPTSGPAPLSAQQLAHVTRATLNDEAFSTLLNEQFQATMLLNQLLASNQFTSSLGPISMQQSASQQQQLAGTQTNPPRSQFTLPNQMQPQMPSAQQVPGSFVPQTRLEQVSGQQQQLAQQYQQSSAQLNARLATVPVSTVDSSQTVTSYQQPQVTATAPLTHQQNLSQPEQSAQGPQVQGPAPTVPTQQQVPPQQPPQSTQAIPSVPFYSIPQIDQSLISLLSNPQVTSNLFSHIFQNIYFQSGARSEPHAHHNPSHHFHHHLHGPHHHHHHHHNANGQNTGQDASLPVDSLAISESKPKGLNRAEIDSLTHYIHTDEKDSRTCVICLSKFELKSKIRPLSCNHAFHAKCVDKWLRANRTCPICRRDALKTHEGKIKRI